MKIKLTKRGRFVAMSLLYLGVLVAVGFSIWIVTYVTNFDYDNQFSGPTITCVADTVIQPDGSCLSQEQ